MYFGWNPTELTLEAVALVWNLIRSPGFASKQDTIETIHFGSLRPRFQPSKKETKKKHAHLRFPDTPVISCHLRPTKGTSFHHLPPKRPSPMPSCRVQAPEFGERLTQKRRAARCRRRTPPRRTTLISRSHMETQLDVTDVTKLGVHMSSPIGVRSMLPEKI